MSASAEKDQREFIAFLGERSSYAPAPEKVERIETHGAMVFLAGEKAYKIKRAVKLSYLDFSTLEQRRATCEREVEINRLTAPQIYRGVLKIVPSASGGFEFADPADDRDAREWVVEMVRFSQHDLLDRMAVEDRLPLELMTLLADHIAAYHDKAPVARGRDGVTGLKGVIASIVEALARCEDKLGAQAAAGYSRAVEEALTGAAPLLARRADAGLVRRCHGDLHLRNIVLLDGQPTLFDAIEFDQELATIDILYDLAFLLMDLLHRGEKHHANAVLNRYLWREQGEANIEGLAALPLFLSVRAGVRAMVAIDRMRNAGGKAIAEAATELGEYFAAAKSFLTPPAPRLVAIGGLSGSGKSTLGALLAPLVGAAPGALHLRSDVERKLLFGKEPEHRLDEQAYTRSVTDKVYGTLNHKAGRGLAAGHSVLLDAVHARPGEREAAERVARAAGVSFTGIWLNAPESELVDRVTKRSGDASDADAEVVHKQQSYDTGTIRWQQLDASGGITDVAAKAAGILGLINEETSNS